MLWQIVTVPAGDSTTIEVAINGPQIDAAKAAGGDVQLQWHFTTEANDVRGISPPLLPLC